MNINRITLVLICCFPLLVIGQQLDKIGSKDAFSMSGGIRSNTVFNVSNNPANTRDALAQVLSGNVAFNILGVSLPFTFSISNRGTDYTQPFNMVALHPSYKNFKAHVGITSMNFGQYTYSGLNFAGGGAEYSWDKWSIKAFGGRLKKAIEYDASLNNVSTNSYRRMGFGVQAGYSGSKITSDVTLFKAYDDPNSLKLPVGNPELTPQNNFVVALKTKLNVIKNLSVEVEQSTSLITQNVRAAAQPEARATDFLVNGNSSTRASTAWNTSIDYSLKKFKIGLQYERIAPDYKTLGAIYFNNDLENYTVTPSLSLLNNKVNISANLGLQRNNLDDDKANISERWVGSGTVTAQLIKGMSLNANYSNFSSFTRRNPTADPFYDASLDTMNFYQVSQNMSAGWNYSFGNKKRTHAVMVMGNYAQSQNITGRLEDAAAFGFNTGVTDGMAPVDVYTGVTSYNLGFQSLGWRIGLTGNVNHTDNGMVRNTMYGPGLTTSKSLLDKKMQLSGGFTYNRQEINQVLTNHVFNTRFALNYRPQLWDKKYGSLNLSVSGNLTNRLAVAPNTFAPRTTTIIINLAYQFK